ncbi:hypothetical protein SAY86_006013 [Trapa natans]|uniref:Ubiquitin carboxyl-terminal hydrolase 14 n=1 Tax=Trapa natans TaxID=22666 RepID=A0AAN7L4G6_TRANT|nr:hypothetical protein SAY86_006013 [Trapa natans]
MGPTRKWTACLLPLSLAKERWRSTQKLLEQRKASLQSRLLSVRPESEVDSPLGGMATPMDLHRSNLSVFGYQSRSIAFTSKHVASPSTLRATVLTSFPDYLVLHVRKFVMEASWVPKKLDVPTLLTSVICGVRVFNLGRSCYLRRVRNSVGSFVLPRTVPENEVELNNLKANEDIVAQLVSMGFNYLHCEKAAIRTSNLSVEVAMDWLLSHMDDVDINDPVSDDAANEGNAFSNIDQSKVDTLISFGFPEDIARSVLKASGGDIEKAMDWIFSNPGASTSSDMDAVVTSSSTSNPSNANLPDGAGKYRLIGIVSHIGTSTHCGHYVAYIYKDGRWAIFNDNKVGVFRESSQGLGLLVILRET